MEIFELMRARQARDCASDRLAKHFQTKDASPLDVVRPLHANGPRRSESAREHADRVKNIRKIRQSEMKNVTRRLPTWKRPTMPALPRATSAIVRSIRVERAVKARRDSVP